MPTLEARLPYASEAARFSQAPLPLSYIPEKRGVSPYSVGIASHELNHALAAFEYGAPVVSISVVPSGDSLGRTILGGICSMDTMKIVAAAGGVGTHDGHAEGFGSDKYKVDVMHHFHGGDSWETARGKASGAISKYSREIREKAAEIIAYLQEVPGSMLSAILLRAEAEVNKDKNGNGLDKENIIIPLVPERQFESHTIIDSLANGDYKITYVVVGKVQKEEYICSACQGINSHREDCLRLTLKDKAGEIVIFKAPLKKD